MSQSHSHSTFSEGAKTSIGGSVGRGRGGEGEGEWKDGGTSIFERVRVCCALVLIASSKERTPECACAISSYSPPLFPSVFPGPPSIYRKLFVRVSACVRA